MARLEDVIGYGTHAARPAAGSAGALYYETDTDTLLRDNGTTWDALSLAGAASPLTTKGDLFTHGTADARLPVGADGEVLTADSTQALGVKWATAAAGGGAAAYALVRDEKPSGTNGGTFTSGAWQTRDLNTVDADPSGIISLAANQITLQAGTYRLKASAPAMYVQNHQIRLQNISDGSTVAYGTSEQQETSSSNGTVTRSFLSCRFTLGAAKALELQHRCAATKAGNGLGTYAGFGNIEVYSVVEVWKE